MIRVGRYKVKPVQDYMILKLVEEQLPSGIVIPQGVDKTKDDSAMFDVLDVGRGYWDSSKFISTEVVAGDVVMLSSYGLGKIVIDKEKFIVGRERDVAMILHREEVEKDAGV